MHTNNHKVQFTLKSAASRRQLMACSAHSSSISVSISILIGKLCNARQQHNKVQFTLQTIEWRWQLIALQSTHPLRYQCRYNFWLPNFSVLTNAIRKSNCSWQLISWLALVSHTSISASISIAMCLHLKLTSLSCQIWQLVCGAQPVTTASSTVVFL